MELVETLRCQICILVSLVFLFSLLDMAPVIENRENKDTIYFSTVIKDIQPQKCCMHYCDPTPGSSLASLHFRYKEVPKDPILSRRIEKMGDTPRDRDTSSPPKGLQ